MGIDIQTYRNRIGRFRHSGIKCKTFRNFENSLKSRIEKYYKKKNDSNRISFSETLMLIIFYTLAFLLLYQNNHNYTYKEIESTNTKISLEKQPYFHLQMRSNSEYWSIGSKKKMNKLNHALNGNRRNLGYKYLAWNCDKGFVAEKKLDVLKVYMHKNKPLIAGVSEVNLVRNENNKM